METTRKDRRTRSRLRHQQIVDAYWHLRALGVDSPAMSQIAEELGDTRVGAVGRLSRVIRSMENRGEWPPKPEAAPGVPASGNGHTNGHANGHVNRIAADIARLGSLVDRVAPALPGDDIADLNTEAAAMCAIQEELNGLPPRSAERIVKALIDQYIIRIVTREDAAA